MGLVGGPAHGAEAVLVSISATTAVVDAPRGEVAAAIAQQASAWRADVIVLTRRRRPAISRMVLGSVADQVIRKASYPVLAVHPRPKVTRNAKIGRAHV